MFKIKSVCYRENVVLHSFCRMSKWTLLSIPHTFFLVSHPHSYNKINEKARVQLIFLSSLKPTFWKANIKPKGPKYLSSCQGWPLRSLRGWWDQMPTGALVWVPLADACHDQAASGPAKKLLFCHLYFMNFYKLPRKRLWLKRQEDKKNDPHTPFSHSSLS